MNHYTVIRLCVRKDSTNVVVNTENCYKSQGLEIQSYRKELCTYPIQWKPDLDSNYPEGVTAEHR
jgi:hypothetical protein